MTVNGKGIPADFDDQFERVGGNFFSPRWIASASCLSWSRHTSRWFVGRDAQ